ncbi:Dynein heavy chain 7, axonemal, partial [Monoraphidium neglectum]
MERKSQLEVMKLTDADYMRRMENAVQFGYPVLLEGVAEELDASLEPLLLRDTFKQGGVTCIRLGDSVLEYSPSFRLYLTTKLRNPHYLPEVAVKVTLLNFSITRGGLEDQVLGLVVARERPELEEDKARLTVQGAENARQLAEIEDRIIAVLSASQGDILEDETAIDVISSSKALANDVAAKQAAAEKTARKIDEARAGYVPVAQLVAALFFVTSELGAVEPMYQYSLAWHLDLFADSITKADRAPAGRDALTKRIEALCRHFQGSLYVQVCRSLFEKDKLLFSFLMAVHVRAHIHKALDMGQLRWLLTGGVSDGGAQPKNPASWLSEKSWGEALRLEAAYPDAFGGLAEALAREQDKFKARHDGAAAAPGFRAVFDAADPLVAPFPAPWGAGLDPLQRLMLLRVLRPDKLVTGIHGFVASTLGQSYVEPPPFDLE